MATTISRMEHAQPVHVEQAASGGRRPRGRAPPGCAAFPPDAAEGPDDGHVADDVDHLAVDRRRLVGEEPDGGASPRRPGGK